MGAASCIRAVQFVIVLSSHLCEARCPLCPLHQADKVVWGIFCISLTWVSLCWHLKLETWKKLTVLCFGWTAAEGQYQENNSCLFQGLIHPVEPSRLNDDREELFLCWLIRLGEKVKLEKKKNISLYEHFNMTKGPGRGRCVLFRRILLNCIETEASNQSHKLVRMVNVLLASAKTSGDDRLFLVNIFVKSLCCF